MNERFSHFRENLGHVAEGVIKTRHQYADGTTLNIMDTLVFDMDDCFRQIVLGVLKLTRDNVSCAK